MAKSLSEFAWVQRSTPVLLEALNVLKFPPSKTFRFLSALLKEALVFCRQVVSTASAEDFYSRNWPGL